jgi:hypothetical protein
VSDGLRARAGLGAFLARRLLGFGSGRASRLGRLARGDVGVRRSRGLALGAGAGQGRASRAARQRRGDAQGAWLCAGRVLGRALGRGGVGWLLACASGKAERQGERWEERRRERDAWERERTEEGEGAQGATAAAGWKKPGVRAHRVW